MNPDSPDEHSHNRTAKLVATVLQGQGSVKNEKVEWSGIVLSELIRAEKFKGGICGDKDMNYCSYLNRVRKNYLKNDEEPLSWKMLPAQKDHLSFVVSFKTHSTWGYSVTLTYLVQMELIVERGWGHFDIIGIEEVGACTEHGTVQMDQTDVGVNLSDTEQKDILQWMRFLDYYDKVPEGVISSDWLMFLAGDEEFAGSVCIDENQVELKREEMRNWWKNFVKMYHPPAGWKNYTTSNLIGSEEKKHTFRINMIVQIGDKESHPLETFDYKLLLNHNLGKFGNIDRFEVMCKPTPISEQEKMTNHAKAYKEVIGRRLQKIMKSPEMWYKSIDTLKDLASPKGYEILNCAGKRTALDEPKITTNDFAKVEHSFWEANKETNGRMEGYDLESPNSISIGIKEKIKLEIWIVWTPFKENEAHESEWKFDLEWDKRL
ncbi:hypothetical protein GCK72_004805 [Caenorhabditis remanei]|uniref:NTF2-like domain-containing protein n=1 Tax=Caenorhabditis remanei TaxID=31234 RepID=A0A6A5HC56_CAERE|nr:hypothetical protein GCK72_004805 [Caenorhabditis remanei]KAF1764855.1 hypothetical protein GCK72_004805 [Caenorhabditis remanei]